MNINPLNIFISFLFTVSLICCTSEKASSNKDEDQKTGINTEGIYIAKNDNVSAFNSDLTPDLKTTPIKIIRFFNNRSGIIIPDQISSDDSLNDEKVHFLYDWCKKYETKNPKDKEYIHFTYTIINNDSITFQQKGPEARVVYQCRVSSDSLKVKYQIVMNGSDSTKNILWKYLNFKFYSK